MGVKGRERRTNLVKEMRKTHPFSGEEEIAEREILGAIFRRRGKDSG